MGHAVVSAPNLEAAPLAPSMSRDPARRHHDPSAAIGELLTDRCPDQMGKELFRPVVDSVPLDYS
ncbi:MAG: hypothetical protein ABI894_09445 [Ilumatobacteraceae bacterium]